MQERTSGLIRGIQVSENIPGSSFIDSRNTSRLNSLSNETVIFIRSIDLSLARHLKDRGCQIGFDLLDRPVADHHAAQKDNRDGNISWRSYDHANIDFFIVNNFLYKDHLAKQVLKPIYVIPHHHVNNGNTFRNDPNRIKTVGYIGLADQLLGVDKLKDACSKLGLSFFMSHPNTQAECIRDLQKIDLGVIFIDGEGYRDSVLKYKPNTKLTNFQSFGIPTIASAYQSFVEFGGENSWISSNSVDTTVSLLEALVLNSKERKEISDLAKLNSEKFEIQNLVKNYYSQLPGFP